MAGDQVTVLRGDEIGLDVVGALPDREGVGLERVFGQVAARAAVADHEGTRHRRRARAAWRLPGRRQSSS
jgi:hypothetical protein